MVAIGARSRELLSNHDERSPAYQPFRTLATLNGKVLAIGIGFRLVGLQHQAQAEAGLLSVVPLRRHAYYLDSEGATRVFVRRDKGGCIRAMPEVVSELRAIGLLTQGRVGQATAWIGSARATLDRLTQVLSESPERNLCREASCVWCREVERRLDLYGRIDRPRWFQNRPIGALFGLINRSKL
jgi:aminoglycoside N3'-acetyltransferase